MGFLYDNDKPQPDSTPLLPAMGKEALASTASSIMAPAAEQINEVVGGGEEGFYARQAKTWRRVADSVRDLIPEDRRQQTEASFVPKEGQTSAWDAPFGTLAMKGAAAVPVIATVAATKNPWAAGIVGGVQGEAQILSDVKGSIDKATDDDLAAQYPSFAEAITRGLPSGEARKLLVSQLASPEVRAWAGAGGAAGAAPFGHIAGGVGRATIGARLGTAAGEGAAGMAVQGGLTDVGVQRGEVEAGKRADVDIGEAIRTGLGSAIEGAAFGGVFGGAREVTTFRGRRVPITKKEVSAEEPSPDVRAALGAEEQPAQVAEAPTGLDAKVAAEQAKIDAVEGAPPASDQPTRTAPPAAPEGTAVLTEYGEPTTGAVARRPRRQMREADIAQLIPDVIVPVEDGEVIPPARPDFTKGAELIGQNFKGEEVWEHPNGSRVVKRSDGTFAVEGGLSMAGPGVIDVGRGNQFWVQGENRSVGPHAQRSVEEAAAGPRTPTTVEPPRTPPAEVIPPAPKQASALIPDRIVEITDLPAVVQARPDLAPATIREVAQAAVGKIEPKLPAQVREARGLGEAVGPTTQRKIGTLVAKKITTELPTVIESRKAAAEERAKARAEGKPVAFKPDATIDLKSINEQAAADFRAKEAEARVQRRAKQMQETDRQAQSVVKEFSAARTPDELRDVLGGDNTAVAQYIKHLQNIVETAKRDRLPIFNESGNVMRNDDRVPTPYVSFIRDAAKILQRVAVAVRDPANLPRFRQDVADLAMQQESLLKGDFEGAAAKRKAKKALGVGDRAVSSRDVADMAAIQGAEADVADAKEPTAKPIRTSLRSEQPRERSEIPRDSKYTEEIGSHQASPEFWNAVERSQEVSTVRDALSRWQPDGLRPVQDARIKGIIQHVMNKVGDAKIVIVPDGTVAEDTLGGVGLYIAPRPGAFKQGRRGLIVVEESSVTFHSLLHEAIHTATAYELNSNPYLKRRAQELLDHVKREYKGDVDAEYGLTDIDEFVAEAMSNPAFQAVLQQIPVPKRLAEFNVRNVWDGFVRLVARSLGLARSQHNALDAAMRLFDEAAEGQSRLQGAVEPEAMAIRRPTREDFEQRFGSSNEWKLRTQRTLDRFASLTQLGNTSDRLFGTGTPARKLVEAIARMHNERENIIQKDDPLLRRMHAASRQYGERFRDFAEFLHDESRAGVFADRDLAGQKHVTKKDGNPTQDGWYAYGQHADLAARWKEFAKTPDFVSLRDALHEHFRARQNDMSLQLINNQLKALSEDGKGSPALAARILEGTTTKADEVALGDALGRIKDAAALSRIPGPYVPFMRRGDFVVQARMDFDTPDNARRLNAEEVDDPAGNTLEFKTEEEARKFVMDPKLDLHPKVETMYVDKDTGSRYGAETDGSEVRITKEDVQAEKRWRVRLEDKHVEFFEREHDAQRRRDELAAAGLKDIAQVDIRRQNAADLNLNFMPEQIRRLAETIRKRDSFKQMPAEAQRELMQQIIDASIGAMGTTRAQTRRLPRTNVAGASTDIARNAQQYSVSTAGYLSKLKHQPEADAILKQMQEYTDAARYERGPAGAEGDMQTMRRQRLQEFEKRIYSGGEYEPTTLLGKSVTRLLQLSYLDKLASPAYHIINSMEPWTVTLPTLAGRHGLFKTSSAMQEAYSAVGALRLAGAGARDTAGALRKDTGLTDYTKTLKERVAGGRDGKELVGLFNKLEETGLLSRNAGFEMGRLMEPGATRLGRTVDRADHMARQMGLAIEAINRAVTGIAAYRLERGKGASHEAAMNYAVEQVHDTMGNYSGWNAPPIFNHPLGRVALQFKKYAQKTYYLLGKQASAALKGDREAMKAFGGILATHMLVAGTLGLPTEAVKVGLTLANVLGVTGYRYDDLEKDLRKTAAGVFGKTGGELFSRGLPRAVGIDLSTRMGLNSLILSPIDPKSMKREDLYAYLAQSFAGAPVSLLLDATQGFQALGKGDVTEATRLLVPLKIYADSISAYQLASQGKKSVGGRQQVDPISPVEALIKTVGFTPAAVAEQQEKSFAIRHDQEVLRNERQDLIGRWIKGQPASRNAEWQGILQWNKGKPPEAQIKYQDLIAAMQRVEKEQRSGTYEKGVRYTKQDRHLRHEFYNVR